jgi:hypothetical protein
MVSCPCPYRLQDAAVLLRLFLFRLLLAFVRPAVAVRVWVGGCALNPGRRRNTLAMWLLRLLAFLLALLLSLLLLNATSFTLFLTTISSRLNRLLLLLLLRSLYLELLSLRMVGCVVHTHPLLEIRPGTAAPSASCS